MFFRFPDFDFGLFSFLKFPADRLAFGILGLAKVSKLFVDNGGLSEAQEKSKLQIIA